MKRYLACEKARVVASTVGAVALLVGCGDVDAYGLDPGSIDPGSIVHDHACFDGSEIELYRYSSACDGTSHSVISTVRDGIVFSSDEVAELESPCGDSPTPPLDVVFDLKSHSLWLDFSSTGHGDQFPENRFEGYVLDFVLQESNGTLLAVDVDRELSTVPFDDADVSFDHSRIEVNLAGVRYDQTSVLHVDPPLARLTPPQP